MSMDQPRRPTRTPGGPLPRPPRSASPIVAVGVALVAAVLGFVILRSLDDDNSTSVSAGGDTTTNTDATVGSTDPATVTTPTTLPPVDRTAFKVLVANASGIAKSAGNLTDQLQALGYQTLTATNAKDSTTKLDVTIVYYVAGAEQAGQDVANTLGKTATVMPTQLPVTETEFAGGTVLVMLGADLSNQTIPGAAAATGAATPTETLAPAGDSPNATG